MLLLERQTPSVYLAQALDQYQGSTPIQRGSPPPMNELFEVFSAVSAWILDLLADLAKRFALPRHRPNSQYEIEFACPEWRELQAVQASGYSLPER